MQNLFGGQTEQREAATHTGRRKIGDFGRWNWSKRAADGKLEVIRKQCPYCFHHKAFRKSGRTECTRCHK